MKMGPKSGHSPNSIPILRIILVVVICLVVVLYVTDEIGIERASEKNRFRLRVNKLNVHIQVGEDGTGSQELAPTTTSIGSPVQGSTGKTILSTESVDRPNTLQTAPATTPIQHTTQEKAEQTPLPPTTPPAAPTSTSISTEDATASAPTTPETLTTTVAHTTSTLHPAASTAATLTQNPADQQSDEVTCKFPALNPWDKTILEYVDHPKGFDCAGFQPYFTNLDDGGYIHFNTTEIAAHNGSGLLSCYWRTVDRAPGDDDNALAFGIMHTFNATAVPVSFDADADTAEVKCVDNGTTIYYNLHNHPKQVEKDIEDSSEDQLSVFFYIHDSVSLSLFRRHLCETYKYLTEAMGLRILHGYTKVADNTYPNMVPVLLGKRVYNQQPDMPDEAPPTPNKQYDTWDLIWKHYAKKGYVTSFIEDSPSIGLFHYLVRGFAEKPVDHYLRPYFKAASNADYGKKYCFGNVPEYENQADITLRVLRKYKDKRHFTYSFYTEMTHNYEAPVERADPMFVNFFEKVHTENLLNRTMMIVMSDHGHRFAGLRATLVGLLEERMPIYGIYLPPWFYKKHPKIDEAIRTNQWRLSANYDVHQTLLDILHSNFSATQLAKGTRGYSQFYEIPADRTCNQAGIPEHYCVCANAKPIALNTEIVNKSSQFLIDTLNSDLKNFSNLCADLKLKDVQRAEAFEVNQFVVQGAKNGEQRENVAKANKTEEANLRIVRILVVASPSDAMLEGSVHVNTKTWEMKIPTDVSRVNAYGNQSICIENPRLRRYCYCKN